MRLSKLFLLLTLPAFGQSVTTTEAYGPVPAIQAAGALGFNIGNSGWMYDACAAMKCKYARLDAPWSSIEPTAGTYTTPSSLTADLAKMVADGIHPILTASFSPTYNAIAVGTVATTVNVGDTTVTMTVTSGALSYTPYQIMAAIPAIGSGQISAKHEYGGTLITGISGNVLTLSNPAQMSVPAGTALTINKGIYPGVLIAPGSDFHANASVVAYLNYVAHLQAVIVAAGLTGYVELWNEPPWPDDCWDHVLNCFATAPASQELFPGLGMELPVAALGLPVVAGAQIISGYTDQGGDASLLSFDHFTMYPGTSAAKAGMAREMYHAYCDSPECHLWLPQTFAQYRNLGDYASVMSAATPVGATQGSQTKSAWFATLPYASGGIQQGIGEMGMFRNLLATRPTETQFTRFALRQILGSIGVGETPVVFYRLDDDGQGSYFYQTQTTPAPAVASLTAVMTDIASVGSPVGPYSPCYVPRVTMSGGTYPLAVVSMVGAQAGDAANSWILFTWQRSYTSGQWVQLASPTAATVTVTIPAGLTVAKVENMNSLATITPTTGSGTISYPQVDDPIEVKLVPATPTTGAPLTCN